jgi:DNA repair ATPase RecN
MMRRLTIRRQEVARMLAGEKIPETAMRHARELLAQAGNA